MQKRCEACGMPLAKKEHQRAAVLARQALWDFERSKNTAGFNRQFHTDTGRQPGRISHPVFV
jgi:hypothetical protein